MNEETQTIALPASIKKAGTGLVLGMGLVLVLAGAALFWLWGDEKAVLFADLEPQDAAGIVAELERMKIDYSLQDGGRRVLVDADTVHETRLKLMGSGVPLAGGVGFELFDEEDFGTTEFAQKINYQRALQGELARTIMAIDEVKLARVHLVLPETSVFKQKKTPTSASVTLVIEPGRRLVREQVSGIQRLVAASAPGLALEQVTILDQRGVTLVGSVSDEEDLRGVGQRLERKRDLEEYLSKKIQSVLDRIFGVGTAAVTVDVVMNLSRVRKTQERYFPARDSESGVVKRRDSTTVTEKGGKERDRKSTTEVEYQLSKGVEQIITTPGSIERVSVAVVVPFGTSEAEVTHIREMIGSAVGLETARGDSIAVYAALRESRPESSNGAAVEAAGEAIPGQFAAEAVPGPREGGAGPWGALRHWTVEHPVGGGVALGGAALVVLLLVALRRRRGGARAPALSDAERNRLLQDVRDWLAAEQAGDSRS